MAHKEPGISSRILRGTVANSAGQAVEFGTGFILTPFILYHLGPTTYGLWALIGSMAAYGTLLDFGLTAAIIKYVAEYRARGETDELRGLIATSLAIYSAMGIVAFLVSVLIARYLLGFLQIPDGSQQTAVWLVMIAGLTMGVSLPFMTAISILRGMHRYDLVNVVNILGTLSVAGGVVTALLLGFGVIGMALVNLPVMILTQFVAVMFIRRLAPELSFSLRQASLRRAWSIFTFSSAISVQNISHHLQYKSDQLVIGAYMPVSAITPYALAFRLGTLALILTRQFIKVLLPLTSELHARAELSRLRELFLTSTRVTIAMFLTFGCSIVVLAGPFLAFWVGSEYASYAHITGLIAAAGLLSIMTWPAEKVLQGMARHRLLALTSISAGLGNLGLSIFLVQRIGLTGVAIGTLIPTLIGVFIVLPYAMKVLKIRIRSALSDIILPSMLPAIPALLTLWLLRESLHPESLIAIGATGAAGAAIYLSGYLVIGTSRLEKDLYWGYATGVYRVAKSVAQRSIPRDKRHPGEPGDVANR